jgi:hypothetical protein
VDFSILVFLILLLVTNFESIILEAQKEFGAVLWTDCVEGKVVLVFKYLLYATSGDTGLLNAIEKI